MRLWGYTMSLFTFLLSYHTIKGGCARQTGEDDCDEVIASLIMMLERSYSRRLQLPIQGLLSAVWKRESIQT